MKLEEGACGQVLDVTDAKKCSICKQWFHKGWFDNGYCNICSRHYLRWRYRKLREEKVNGYRYIVDTSVQAFRELYTAGILDDTKPWTWEGEDEVPRGALDPCAVGYRAIPCVHKLAEQDTQQ